MYLILAAVFALTIVYLKCWNSRQYWKHPPGPPWPLPFLGHLLLLGRKPHLAFLKWRTRYGPVVGWKMGPYNAIVVSDQKLVRELFSKEAASGRQHSPIYDIVSNRTGLLTSEGETSSEQRTFVKKTFKDIGLAKGGTIETIILGEAQLLLKYLEQRASTSVEVSGLFTGAVMNNMWAIISGENHDWTGCLELDHIKVFKEYLTSANKILETGLVMAPWLRYIIPEWSGWNRFLNATTSFYRMTENVVANQQASGNIGDSHNFIGQFLNHMEGVSDPDSSFYKVTGRKNCIASVSDLMAGGTDTTTCALEFAMLYLSYHPQVQVEMQAELDTVVGSHLPTLSDKLPYLEAVVLEVLRYASHIPIGFPHRAQKDMEFAGYFIPKDTILFADHYNIQHDPVHWTDPDKFRPERFLNANKSQVIRNESLIPFSVGRRNCVGESIAKSTLVLFLACLLQKFTVVYHGKEEVNLLEDVIPGIVMKPKPFQIVFKMRNGH